MDEPTLTKISIHPNGFVQLFIGERRIRVWASDIPRQTQPTPIHNHRFSFTSTVLFGTLIDVQYIVTEEPDGDYESFGVVNAEGLETILRATGQYFRIVRQTPRLLKVGDIYSMSIGRFHESRPHGFCVTEIVKTSVTTDMAYVLVPRSYPPDNTFWRTQ